MLKAPSTPDGPHVLESCGFQVNVKTPGAGAAVEEGSK
jgi:hypothetical protein